MTKLSLLSIAIIFMTACNQSSNESSTGTKSDSSTLSSDQQIIQTAKEAYDFGFPLVVMDLTRRVITNTEHPDQLLMRAPINQLVSANKFPDDKFRDVVRPNCDTYYTISSIDLSKEPLVLEMPDTKGRYVLLPMLDAWTNIFFSPGKRTSGTGAQSYLLTGPNWKGEVPKGLNQQVSPTNMVWLLGRTQVNSAKDGSTVVKKIQDGYKLIPLSAYSKSYTAPAGTKDSSLPKKSPNEIISEMSVSDYFNLLNQLMVVNPPLPADSAIMKKLGPLGISPGGHFDLSKFSPELQDSLKNIPAWGINNMKVTGLSLTKPVNGWMMNHGLGTYGTDYSKRAGVAFGGLGANLDADAMYPSSITDADGEIYDGSKHGYIIHFDPGKLPPANAFWSLTMYDKDGFLCSNDINRFAIGDRDHLKKNPDGSLDIFIQINRPGKNKEPNWLPAPNGPFNLLLRVYWPKEEMINGSWNPPPVKKQT
ncbi:MAG TPA: DUF1254 domain-containing protein [Puia sp.]|nr:DUF1254 domain-containing protein [Puia sp.]